MQDFDSFNSGSSRTAQRTECYLADAPDTRLLSGDWMFSRSTEVPSAVSSGPTPPDDRPSKLQWKLSETAARSVFRKRCLQMWDLSSLLEALQEDCVAANGRRRPDRWLQAKLDLKKHRSQFDRKMLDEPPTNWSPDELFKLAAITDEADPAPLTLEWATMLTWLVLEQGKTRGRTLPPNLVLYSAAALETVDKGPATSSSQTFATSAESWIHATQRRIDSYLKRSSTLLDESSRTRLRPLISPDGKSELVDRVLRTSRFVRQRFKEWGMQTDDD